MKRSKTNVEAEGSNSGSAVPVVLPATVFRRTISPPPISVQDPTETRSLNDDTLTKLLEAELQRLMNDDCGSANAPIIIEGNSLSQSIFGRSHSFLTCPSVGCGESSTVETQQKQCEDNNMFCGKCFFIDPPGEKGVKCLVFQDATHPQDKPRNAVCYVPNNEPQRKRDQLVW